MSIHPASADSPTCAGTALLQRGFGLNLARRVKLRGVCRSRREAEKREEPPLLVLGCLVYDGPKLHPFSCPSAVSPTSQLHPDLG